MLFRSNTFKLLDTDQDIAVARQYIDYITNNALDKAWLSEFGIANCWATLMYFRKTEFTKTVFESVGYIRNHWEYYQTLYRFYNKFRNDYAFAIALHELSGGKITNEFDHPYPIKNIHSGHVLLFEKNILIGDDIAVTLGSDNLHIMDKNIALQYANGLLNG